MVLLLDAYHLGDPLFLAGFTRDVSRRDQSAPHIFAHGGGEAAERALEARGEPAERQGGVLQIADPEASLAVERATRELGREITAALNEAGVPAVRFTGADRGLLRYEGGTLVARTDWLLALARQGAVPVVTALVAGGEGRALREEAAGAAAAALAQATGLRLGLLGARSASAEAESAAREARSRGVEVVENARSGWTRRAGLAG
jgi:acetylglutamate kinase